MARLTSHVSAHSRAPTNPAVRYFRDDCGGDLRVWERSFDAGEVLAATGATYVDHYKWVYQERTGKPYD